MAENKLTLASATEMVQNELIADLEVKTTQGLAFPTDYNARNAIMSAMLIIKQAVDKDGKPALAVCTQDSIKQAVWETLVRGLDPQKKQCYYIVYGDKLSCTESYFGLQMRAKRSDPNIKDVYAQVVYEGDIVEYSIENGVKQINSHTQNIDNIDSDKLKGAYATILYKDGSTTSEYMTIAQIRKSWAKSKTQQAVHREFPDMMAKRTVLKRLCNSVVNTSKDEPLFNDVSNTEQFNEEAETNEATVMIDITPPEEEVKEIPKKVMIPKQVEMPTEDEELPDCLK